MTDNSKTPSRNTELFASLPPEIAVIINDVIHAVFSILGWHQASKSLLAEILSRIAETDSFEQSHDEFCAALWPYLDKKRRKEKISRWIAKLRIDMEVSRFNPVFIPKQKVTRTNDGGFKGHPTTYKIGHFWKLFRYVQDNARNVDLLSLSVNKRRAHVRVFTAEWLEEAGAVKIIREKKSDDAKPAKPSPPCKCSCASCAHCAAKGVTASEAENGARPAWERVSSEGVEAQIQTAMEILFTSGQQWMNMNRSLPDFVRKIHAGFDIEELRLRDAVKRVNRNGGLKLVGGQPK